MESTPLPPALAGQAQDLFTRVQCFGQLPEYEVYLEDFGSLPKPPESGGELTWPFPTPPTLGYDQALPGYVAPFLQSLTPLSCGGARRSAPWPPPRHHTREETVGSPGDPVPSAGRTYQSFSEIPEAGADPSTVSPILASRMLGDPRRIAELSALQPLPGEPQDALLGERLAVHGVLREDASLRYHVDRRRFFRTSASGETREVLSLARARQILRQGQARLKTWLALLPYEQHLSTPPPPAPPRPARRAAAAASPATTPPASGTASASAAAGAPAPAAPASAAPAAGAAPAPTALGSASVAPPVPPAQARVAAAATPEAAAPVLPAEVAPPQAQALPQAAPVEVPPPALPTAPLSLKIHRYWDLAAGAYCEVSQVVLEGEGCDESPLVNTEKLPAFVVQRNLPLGASVKITVTWANGQTRSWEDRLSRHSGLEAEVFSPDG